jgi:hypothetical protein
MKTTKSGKVILTKEENIEQERQEMIEAKKQALLQEEQRQKKVYYLPMIGGVLVLIGVLSCVYSLIYAVGFIVGESSKICPTISCPYVQPVCELPKT